MTEHNKLVRDNIPEICEADGVTAEFRVLEDDGEYLNALIDKMHEEIEELREARSIEERADVEEVLRAIDVVLNFKQKTIEEARIDKELKRGGF